MQHGFVLPAGTPEHALEAGILAESAGWDGFFMWEPVWGVDPWVTLAGVATRTERVRLGTMLTPLSRRRPWKVASETVTLDHLSKGRAVLATGLGAVDTGFDTFGEETDRRTRAELLDEALAIITGLWAGQPFEHVGSHYTVRPTDSHPPPPPVQQPRIPIWVVGALGRPRSMRRALAYDGIIPTVIEDGQHVPIRPHHLEQVRAVAAAAGAEELDIVIEGSSGADPEADELSFEEWAAAGATWWLETMWTVMDDPAAVLHRISQGPAHR